MSAVSGLGLRPGAGILPGWALHRFGVGWRCSFPTVPSGPIRVHERPLSHPNDVPSQARDTPRLTCEPRVTTTVEVLLSVLKELRNATEELVDGEWWLCWRCLGK
jgi:hypothetical protein